MRQLFSNGWNSVAHVGLGAASAQAPAGRLLFVGAMAAWQFWLSPSENSSIDFSEYMFGWFLGDLLSENAPSLAPCSCQDKISHG